MRDSEPDPRELAADERGQWRPSDPAIRRVRAARRRYWAARAGGDPGEIEQALREWTDAQLAAAEAELRGSDRNRDVVSEAQAGGA